MRTVLNRGICMETSAPAANTWQRALENESYDVVCLLPTSPGDGRGFVVSDPVVRARRHANEKAAKEHARVILRLLPLAHVAVWTLDAYRTVTPTAAGGGARLVARTR